MVTIYDIAAKAGVSHNTVSLALRNSNAVKDTTKWKIMRLAEEMGYRKNQAAVSLKAGCSKRVALIVPQFSIAVFQALILHLEQLCNQDGYELILLQLASDQRKARRTFENLLQGGYDAAAVFLYEYSVVRDLIELFLAQQRAMVLVGAPLDFTSRPGLFPLSVDPTAAVRDGVNMLMALGHRYIAHCILPEEVSKSGSYRVICDAIRGKVEESWDPAVFYSSSSQLDFIQDGYRTAEILLREKPQATAVQCVNDLFACGLMRGLQEQGIRVPADISVIGADNMRSGEFLSVSLSTIDMRQYDTAMMIWELLRNQLLQPDWDCVPSPVTLRANLIIRESTGKARSGPLEIRRFPS